MLSSWGRTGVTELAATKEPDAPILSQGLWGGITVIAVLSLVAYAYSFAYLFRIEPQFISAFSPVDLIMWAASSLYIVIAITITLLLGLGSVLFWDTIGWLIRGGHREATASARQLGWPRIFRWTSVILVFAAFLFGDYEGRAARRPNTQPRAWVCGDSDRGPCHPLIFIGSEKLVFAANGKFVLRRIADRHWIASQGAFPY